MLELGLLQVGWFVDFVPAWLGPLLVGTGIILLIIGLIHRYEIIVGDIPYQPDYRFGLLLLTCLATMYPWITTHTDVFALTVVLFARTLEGGTTVRFSQKILKFKETSNWGGGGKELKRKILYRMTGVLAIILGVWIAIGLVIFGPISNSLAYDLALVWTLVTLSVAVLGVVWKLSKVDQTVPVLLGLGVVLAFAGVEIYNYINFITQIGSFVLGNIAFTSGYLIALWIWGRERGLFD